MPWVLLTLIVAARLRKRRLADGSAEQHGSGPRPRRLTAAVTVVSIATALASAYAAIAALRVQTDALDAQTAALTLQIEQAERHQAEQVLLIGFDPGSPPDFVPDPEVAPRIQNFSRLPLSAVRLRVDRYLYDMDDTEPSASLSDEYKLGNLNPCTQAVFKPFNDDGLVFIGPDDEVAEGFDFSDVARTDFDMTLLYVDTAGQPWARRNSEAPVRVPLYDPEYEDGFSLSDEPIERAAVPSCVPA